MSQNRALIQATPHSTLGSSLVATVSTAFAAVTAFFAGSADARQQARNAAYLSEATDLYDLEARVRELDNQMHKQSALA